MRHARQCQKRPITVSKETRRPPQHCWPHDGDDVCLMLSCSDISLIVREQARVFRMYPPPHLKWTEMSGHLANRQRESTCERERGREGGEGGGGRARSSGRKVHQHPPDGYVGHTHGHWSSLHILHHKSVPLYQGESFSNPRHEHSLLNLRTRAPSPPRRQPLTLSSQRHFGGNCDSRQSLALVPKYISWLDQSPLVCSTVP